MPLLIDGYNLLHVTGIVGKGSGPGSFQRSREALLRFLAASIDQKERNQTTVVFDASDAPPGLPRTLQQEGMTVRYASEHADADALIEELIQQYEAPRKLLVVSSDHRIQRAAKRRRAGFIDSDRWYSQLWQQRLEKRKSQSERVPEKPIGNLSEAEINYWVDVFSADDTLDSSTKSPPSNDSKPSPAEKDLDNPFPPGYGEDLL